MEPEVSTGTSTPESVVASAPAAAAAQPAAASEAEANSWEHRDEYDPDLTAAGPAVETPAQSDQQPSAQPAVSPAGALKPDTTAAPTTEGQPAAVPGPVPYERFHEVNTKAAKMQEMAEFYQRQYNELVAQQQPGTAPAPAQPGTASAAADSTAAAPAPDGKLPPGIKGPGEWDTQEEMAAYYDHVATTRAQAMVRTEIATAREAISSQFQAMAKQYGHFEDMLVRSIHKDFDAVTKPVMAELFVSDHEGNIWTDPQGNPKVKNPALLNWIRQSPSPRKALYDYALSRQAPGKITEAVRTTTKQLLTALDTRPKGPTQPRQAGGDNRAVSLDWNTPKDVADRVLAERGVI